MGLLDDFSTLSDSAKQYALNALARFGNGVGDTVQAIPGNAQKLAQGLLNLPHDVSQTFSSQPGGLFSPQLGQQVNQAMSQPQQANPGQWMDKGMALAGMAPVMGLLGHTVYHGSPHKFDKFDMSKIGTGEGAQAYGHGLYFAEAPDVAQSYQKALSQRAGGVQNRGSLNGVEYPSLDSASKKAMDILKLNDENIEFAIKFAEKNQPDAASILKTIKAGKANVSFNEGNLYKVDIPDESIPRMLDWDAPLSKQAPEVQAALEPAIKNAVKKYRDIYGDDRWMTTFAGQQKPFRSETDALDYLKNTIDTRDAYYMFGPQEEATKQLAAKGIPGIRYLDGSSRGAGQGTSNFVLFDDQLPRILEVNGKPTGLKPWNEQ